MVIKSEQEQGDESMANKTQRERTDIQNTIGTLGAILDNLLEEQWNGDRDNVEAVVIISKQIENLKAELPLASGKGWTVANV